MYECISGKGILNAEIESQMHDEMGLKPAVSRQRAQWLVNTFAAHTAKFKKGVFDLELDPEDVNPFHLYVQNALHIFPAQQLKGFRSTTGSSILSAFWHAGCVAVSSRRTLFTVRHTILLFISFSDLHPGAGGLAALQLAL